MSTWLPQDTKLALRRSPSYEPTRCDSRSLLLLRMPLSADSKAASADARKTSLERALKPGAHAAAEHRSKWLDALISSARLRRFQLWTDQRLALGLANGVLENAGLDLHRFWGTPEISGSKLKGVAAEFTQAELDSWSMVSETPSGALRHLKPVVQLPETPPRWARPSVPLGYHRPEWPART